MEIELKPEYYDRIDSLAHEIEKKDYNLALEMGGIGHQALHDAVKTYDPNRGAQFITHAITCARNAMCTFRKQRKRLDLTHDDNVVIEQIAEENETLVENPNEGKMDDVVRDIVDTITDSQRDADMFLLHIGIDGNDRMDYKEIGAQFNVSAERVRQICVKVHKEIKANSYYSEILHEFAHTA